MRLHLTINWKLFHTADSQPVGQMVAAVKPEGVQVQWTDFCPSGADMLLPDLSRMLEVVRHHVGEHLRDRRYTSFWNENTGIETQVKELL